MKNQQQHEKIIFTSNANLKLSRQPATTQADAAQPPVNQDVTTLKGYALVWNVLSSARYAADGSVYFVRLMPNSATFTTPCRALYEHESPRLIGTTANGTLRILPADEIGIPFENDLPDTTSGRDVVELVEDNSASGGPKPYVTGMSFTMLKGLEDSFVTTENGQKIVNATKYTVSEVSVVSDPAFSDTSVVVKEPEADDQTEADPEFSKSQKEIARQSLKLQRQKLYLYGL